MDDAGNRAYRDQVEHHLRPQSERELHAASLGEIVALRANMRPSAEIGSIDMANRATLSIPKFWSTATYRRRCTIVSFEAAIDVFKDQEFLGHPDDQLWLQDEELWSSAFEFRTLKLRILRIWSASSASVYGHSQRRFWIVCRQTRLRSAADIAILRCGRGRLWRRRSGLHHVDLCRFGEIIVRIQRLTNHLSTGRVLAERVFDSLRAPASRLLADWLELPLASRPGVCAGQLLDEADVALWHFSKYGGELQVHSWLQLLCTRTWKRTWKGQTRSR